MDRHRHRHGHGDRDLVMRGPTALRYNQVVARWVLPPLYRAVAADAAALVPRGGAVLDVGTGSGRLLVELGRRRPDLCLVGVDPSADMVAMTKAHLASSASERAQALVARAEELPFPDGHFDFVASTLSAHHWSDPARALHEQARVVRPGGQVRVYDLRSREAALPEDCRAAGLLVLADAPTRLGRLPRFLLTVLVAVRPAEPATP